MKIVIISFVYPWPVDNGKKVVLNGFIEYLSNIYGGNKITYIYIGEYSDINIEKYGIKVVSLNKTNKLIGVINVLYRSFFLREKSIQESIVYSGELKKRIIDKLNEIKADLIIVDTVRVAQLLKKEKYWGVEKSILYMDDLFSIRYEKMLKIKRRYKKIDLNPIGNFKKNLPFFSEYIIKINLIETLLLKFEKKLIKKSEIEAAQSFKKSLLINKNEVDLLNKVCKKEVSQNVFPWICKLEDENRRNYTNSREFLFLGSLNISHNRVSIINFIKTQSDEIRKSLPDIKIKIIGKSADDNLVNLVEKNNDIFSLEGYISNIESTFRGSCAMIIPLLFGTGVKLKTIEAMFYGLPIISTSYGVESINLTKDHDCFVDDDIYKFVSYMKILLNKEVNMHYSKMIKNAYNREYSRDVIYEKYNKIFKNETMI